MLKRIFSLLLILFLTLPTQIASAQEPTPDGPIYIVQSGDTFYLIAIKFNVLVDDMVNANPNINPNMLSVGQEVVIPGLEGIRGRLETHLIGLGESLRTLSIRDQVTQDQVIKLNRITSPAEVFAGASLIIPLVENELPARSRYLIGENQSLFQLAIQNNLNPWLIAETNQIKSTWDVLPGEAIFEKSAAEDNPSDQVSLISPVVKELKVSPLPIQQGETTVVTVITTEPIELTGSLAGRELHFYPNGENTYVALQGVFTMSDPGIYPITLNGKLKDGTQFSFEQMLILEALGYIREKIDGVDPSTMDPANTKPEDDQIKQIISPSTPIKYWDGLFGVPGYDATWITSTFGNRRSYNGGGYNFFHTGVDYGGGTGLPIKAPASGIVVFAGPLTVRGNATLIDHGWGVYSGFWHQSEFRVQVGDRVDTGQVIGLSGGTGRITGPHLHWEIWVNGVQVDPFTWLGKVFP